LVELFDKYFQRGIAAAAPIIVAVKSIHKCSRCPDIIAGASERAGFIDAPQIGPANIASNKTVEPIAKPANIPCSLLPVATFIITNIRKKVSKSSKMKDCDTLPVGMVAPKNSFSGNRYFRIILASIAPML
jgi:hypothetical protein